NQLRRSLTTSSIYFGTMNQIGRRNPSSIGVSNLARYLNLMVEFRSEVMSRSTEVSFSGWQKKVLNEIGVDVSAMAPFVPGCCCVIPDFLADSRSPVHLVPAEPP